MAASVKPRKREYDAVVKADLLLLNSTNIVAQVPLFSWVSAEMKKWNVAYSGHSRVLEYNTSQGYSEV